MFGFSFDKRMLWVILGVMLLLSITNLTQAGLVLKLLTIPGVIIAITFHEFAHAYSADRLGDDTPRRQGRLTLNPLKHIEPVGFMLLFVAGFGWGRPVEIQSRNFNREITMSKAEAIVSVAGPIMNFILAFIFLIVMYIMKRINPSLDVAIYLLSIGQSLSSIGIMGLIYTMVFYTVMLNIGLGVFNLIPLPPLDGSKILMHFLPHNARQWFIQNQHIFYIIFIIIWITGLSSTIISPIFNVVYGGMDFVVKWFFSLF